MNPPNRPNEAEFVTNLGLDKLDKTEQDQVLDFLNRKDDYKNLVKENASGMRDALAKELEGQKQKRADIPAILETIFKKIFEEIRRKDTSESFKSSTGEVVPGGYEGFYKKLVEEEGVDFKGKDSDPNNSIKKACWGKIQGALNAVPVEVQRQVCSEYAEYMIRDFVSQMDDAAEILKVGTLNQADVSKLKPKSFEEWARENGKSMDKITHRFDPKEAKEFSVNYTYAITEINNFKNGISGVPNDVAEFFTKEVGDIENLVPDNPTKAVDELKKMVVAFSSVKALLETKAMVQDGLKKVIEAKGTVPDYDVKIETDLNALALEIDKNVNEYLNNKDASKLKLEEIKNKFEEIKKRDQAFIRPLAPPAPAPAEDGAEGGEGAEGAEGAEDGMDIGEIMKNPMGWLGKMAKDNWFFGAIFAFAGPYIAKLFGKEGEAGGEAGGDAGGGKGTDTANPATPPAETPPEGEPADPKAVEIAGKTAKITKQLSEKFKFIEDELKVLAPLLSGTVTAFLGLEENPQNVDKGRFDLLKRVITKLGGTDKTEGSLLDFLIINFDKLANMEIDKI